MNYKYLSCDIIEYGFDVQINSIDLCCRISGDTDDKKYVSKAQKSGINLEPKDRMVLLLQDTGNM